MTTVQGAWVTLTFDWTPEHGGFVPNAGVLVSLLGAFNLSVFALELTWVLISAYGIVRSLRSADG